MASSHLTGAYSAPTNLGHEIKLAAVGDVQARQSGDCLQFTVTHSQPHNFGHKHAVVRSYLESERRFRLPLRLDLTLSLDAPGFCLMLGETGQVHFCSTWDDARRIVDIVKPPTRFKSMFFANQMPLNTPTEIAVIYNLNSMQILIGGEQRYVSTKEPYMKRKDFQALNAAGLMLRLTCHKRAVATVHTLSVTEGATDFALEPQAHMPDPVMTNIALRPGDTPSYEAIIAALGGRPTFESVIANLPDETRAKVAQADGFLRAYKPIKFRRSIEKNGNKITYLASSEGLSYMILPSRDLLTHTLEWYLLFNNRERWGTRKADNLIETLDRLAGDDTAFATRMFSYLKDCTGCCGSDCKARTPYTFRGETKQTCHGKIEFTMQASEFDDALRLIQAIPR